MNLKTIREELYSTLKEHVIPFWLERSIDTLHGGYLTSLDEKGEHDGNTEKNIVIQSRMLWGFSNLIPFAREEDKSRMQDAAHQGARFIADHFWDKVYGGFFWKVNRDGSILDGAKLTYGESFAIYALSEYYLMSHNAWALEYAEMGFDHLQKYAADTFNGGYFENIEKNWELAPKGHMAGDRKSLDIHMHLLEAFTTLYLASRKGIHARKLKEVYDLIIAKMVNITSGYGYNQFDSSFNKIPAIAIPRTWNSERAPGEIIVTPADTTSYGHNIELSWLVDLTLDVLDTRTANDDKIIYLLLDHTLKHGFDYANGGVYRDGIGDEKVLVTDKEWWQNFESMTGFINGYAHFGNPDYLTAFELTWSFIKKFFMNYEVGESRQLLKKDGTPIVSRLGNPWKGIYHTGRAFAESIKRLDACIYAEQKKANDLDCMLLHEKMEV